ncbi:MAG: MBOAT family protein [Lachnospiraceae bacterium]|nr:MBOAT family protein [Lachnospiraceae bacterium]
MEFNSINFMIFFPVVLALYFVIPKALRQIWLLAASYYFYMSWNARYALLIAASTLITYVSGIAIERYRESGRTGRRLTVLFSCLGINLGILLFFKYGNFLIASLDRGLELLHIGSVDQRFYFLLPVGISFYTFQALGYTIDVYRGDVRAETNLIRYALFVSFFPQLVAGPIERSKNLLSQMQNIAEIKLWNARRVTSGTILMIWGFFVKMVIADRAAVLVNTVFDNYHMYGSTELVLAAVFFALQIYCDFGSYSLIAIGAAKIMGFELMENFNTPYFACSIRDFWSRWHISLSTWFRDYLYIPLGGNRRGRVRKSVNIMIVFLASGLWHGADWSYVVWGGIHGAYQVIGDYLASFREKCIRKLRVNTACFSWKFLQTTVTFILVVFAWIFFRADSIGDALQYIRRIWVRPTPWVLFNGEIFTLGLDRPEMNILLVSICMLGLVDLVRYRKKMTLDVFLMQQNLWFRGGIMIGLVVLIFVCGKYGVGFDPQQFIYFQF